MYGSRTKSRWSVDLVGESGEQQHVTTTVAVEAHWSPDFAGINAEVAKVGAINHTMGDGKGTLWQPTADARLEFSGPAEDAVAAAEAAERSNATA